jgi:YfiR/HmsC-like
MAFLKRALPAALLGLALLLAALPAAVRAQVAASEYDVKAAFLFNFTKFVEWPGSAFSDDRGALQLCVFGGNPFGKSLEAVAGEEVGGHRLGVRRVEDTGKLAGCHVLFIDPAESSDRTSQVLSSVRGEPVLTVGDNRGFLDRGGIINFVLEGTKVRFEINQEAAERAGLKISSKLLRLAFRVTPGTKPGP